jgi:hypothetical protein
MLEPGYWKKNGFLGIRIIKLREALLSARRQHFDTLSDQAEGSTSTGSVTRQKTGERRNIACKVSFLAFFNWISISVTLHLAI